MKKILVIDDEHSVRLTVKKLLQKQGFELFEADSGETGLELARTQLPDLVLSDVNMGGIDGFDVLKGLRTQAATSVIPVILMTGVPEQADVRYSMDRGADDYLVKPFEATALLRAVNARLKRQDVLQAQAKENESRLLEILSATQDLVAIVDSVKGNLLYLNLAGRKMLDIGILEDTSAFQLAQFIGDAETNLTPKDQVARATQDGMWLGETTFVSRSGRRIPVSKQILAHRSGNGQSAYLSVVARDITDRKRAERERQLMELQLRQAQKLEAIGQLAAGIAHEINTPIQFVGDNTRFLRDAFTDITKALVTYGELFDSAKQQPITTEEITRVENALTECDFKYLLDQIPAAIRETLEGLERVTKIVRAMKEFSHPGGKEKTPADINKAIDTTVTVARNEWKYVADVFFELDPDLPRVPCYVGDFNQAVLNLIVNAAHAIADATKGQPEAKGRIIIRTKRVGDHVEVRVTDTGSGISEVNRSKIFEPFFTTKEIGKGTGQGLAIVYANIVKKHGGTVEFETEVGKGTTFILRLPLSEVPS